MFVPPQVIDQLSKNTTGDTRKAAIATAKESNASRKQRAAKQTPSAAAAPKAGAAMSKAPRTIYDCETQWNQRVTIVRKEGQKSVTDKDVNTTYDLAGTVRSFWQDEMGWDSIDNNGMELLLNVHYGTSYMNAFWDGDEMTFGDGDGQIFSGFCRSLDVIGHELGHGVVQSTAALEYHDQPGALNEHYADVFGTAVTQWAAKQTPTTADWLIGDEIMGPTLYGEALRSMKAPGTAYNNGLIGRDPQPAHMSDFYSGAGDNGGVHINSGIMNKAFYLVASGLGDTVQACKLWFHALQSLTPTADFSSAALTIAESARLMTRDNELPLGATQLVRSSFAQVGVV